MSTPRALVAGVAALTIGIALPGIAMAQQHDHSKMNGEPAHEAPVPPSGADELLTPIPALTDADRAAAFPTLTRPMVHARELNSLIVVDRLEAWNADPGTGAAWEAKGWIGSDLNRVWLRTEGERTDGRTEAADVELLYGRSVSPWWDTVVGLKQDFEGGSQTWVAFGVQGLAPYKFEVQATVWLGESGRTAAGLEIEYELLLTNRLILQPLVELKLFGKDDPGRGVGSGLSTAEAGLRLRYEIRRQFAPYIGIVYERAFGDTGDLRRAESGDTADTRVMAGARIWF